MATPPSTLIITLNPQYAAAYGNRGWIRNLQGDKDGAIKDLETAANLFQKQRNIAGYNKTQELLQLIRGG